MFFHLIFYKIKIYTTIRVVFVVKFANVIAQKEGQSMKKQYMAMRMEIHLFEANDVVTISRINEMQFETGIDVKDIWWGD